jgi:predicted Zn-dependent protease
MAFNARAAEEGRSYFSKPGGGTRLGEKVFDDSVTLRSDPTDPRVPGSPWAGGGLPARKTVWIENGVVRNLTRDRYWAKQTGREPVPFSGSVVLEGGSGSLDELIARTERALLVTRFWYIRSVNAREGVVTGLTRDGVWLVEKGKIAYPVNNFRFNDGAIRLLQNVDAMSAPYPTGSGGSFFSAAMLPAIRARTFLFTSKSDAI